jgi:Sec-independent protein translocase protein TatA
LPTAGHDVPKLKTQSRQLSFAATYLESRAERNVFITEPTSGTAARAKGSLYIVTETEGDSPGERAFCRLIADHVRTEYYRDPARGPAAGLRAAMRTAGNKIYLDERNAVDSNRPIAALTCIAACDGDVAVAQTLPVQTYLVTGNTLKMTPDPPAWDNDTLDFTEHQYIGHTANLACSVADYKLSTRDVVLVCSSALAQRLPLQQLHTTLLRRDVSYAAQTIRSWYSNASFPSGYGLLWQFVPDLREDLATDQPETSGPSDIVSGVFNRLRAAASAPPWQSTPECEKQRKTTTPASAAPASLPASSTGSSSRRERTEQRGASSPLKRNPGFKPAEAVRRRSPAAMVRRDLPVVTRLGGPARLPMGLIAGIAVLLVVIVVLVIGTMKIVQNVRAAQHVQQVQRIVAQVRAQENAADQATDAAAQEQLLIKAQQMADANKDQLSPNDYTALRAETQAKIDQIESIGHLGTATPIADLTAEKGLFFGQVLVDGDTIYALDQGNHRVLVASGAGGKPTIPLLQGSRAGTEVAGNMITMALTTNGLLALDDRHVLWRYAKDKKDIARLRVPGSENWQDPRSMVVMDDKLLVLDAKQGRIFQNSLQGTTFGPQTDYLAPNPTTGSIDLSHAVALAADATSAYVLLADGAILKFTGGTRVPFQTTGLATKITAPSGFFASGRDAAIYVADPSNRRVVKFAKDGRFLQQLLLQEDQSKRFGVVQSLAVDESQNKAIIVTESTLASAPLSSP